MSTIPCGLPVKKARDNGLVSSRCVATEPAFRCFLFDKYVSSMTTMLGGLTTGGCAAQIGTGTGCTGFAVAFALEKICKLDEA